MVHFLQGLPGIPAGEDIPDFHGNGKTRAGKTLERPARMR